MQTCPDFSLPGGIRLGEGSRRGVGSRNCPVCAGEDPPFAAGGGGDAPGPPALMTAESQRIRSRDGLAPDLTEKIGKSLD